MVACLLIYAGCDSLINSAITIGGLANWCEQGEVVLPAITFKLWLLLQVASTDWDYITVTLAAAESQ